MNETKPLFKPSQAGLVLVAALVSMLTGCVGYYCQGDAFCGISRVPLMELAFTTSRPTTGCSSRCIVACWTINNYS
jgi:hypothetical protein